MTLLANVSGATLSLGQESIAAAFGKNGACPAADKRESDGKTPLGRYRLVTALLRPDRMPTPATMLPWRWLRPSDGWSDDPHDPAYNRPVRHPHAFSAERLWRDDHAYDIVIILSHNTAPVSGPKPGAGSAIFLHCTQPDRRPTEGCIAVPRDTLARWLAHITPTTQITIE